MSASARPGQASRRPRSASIPRFGWFRRTRSKTAATPGWRAAAANADADRSVRSPSLPRSSGASSVLEQAHLRGLVHGLAARMHRELAVDLLDVRGDGVRRNAEDLADFVEAHSLGEELEDLGLTCRQWIVLWIDVACRG